MIIQNSIRFVTLFILLSMMTSCVGHVIEDPADQFVGTYSYNETYSATWGSAYSSFSHSGTFTITKTGPSTIKISSPWNTTGRVTGMILNLDPVTQGDNNGSVNYTFTSASLAGGILTITYQGTGSLRYTDGRNYPYSCHGNISARKTN